jgi:hypothetical protein
MKTLLCRILILGISLASTGVSGNALPNGEMTLFKKTVELAKKGDYESVYSLLGSDYTAVVSKEEFARVSEERHWEIVQLHVGALRHIGTAEFSPISAAIRMKSQELQINAIVFFSEKGETWSFVNFPFVRPSLPLFGLIPKGLPIQGDSLVGLGSYYDFFSASSTALQLAAISSHNSENNEGGASINSSVSFNRNGYISSNINSSGGIQPIGNNNPGGPNSSGATQPIGNSNPGGPNSSGATQPIGNSNPGGPNSSGSNQTVGTTNPGGPNSSGSSPSNPSPPTVGSIGGGEVDTKLHYEFVHWQFPAPSFHRETSNRRR